MLEPGSARTRVSCNNLKGMGVSYRYTAHEVGDNHIVGDNPCCPIVERKDDCHLFSVGRVKF
jgi:hypothetical protein